VGGADPDAQDAVLRFRQMTRFRGSGALPLADTNRGRRDDENVAQ
jgi:hypothetical protein